MITPVEIVRERVRAALGVELTADQAISLTGLLAATMLPFQVALDGVIAALRDTAGAARARRELEAFSARLLDEHVAEIEHGERQIAEGHASPLEKES